MSNDDIKIIKDLTICPMLSYMERTAIKELLKEHQKLKEAKDWENPYSKAIAVLESASRSFEGSFG